MSETPDGTPLGKYVPPELVETLFWKTTLTPAYARFSAVIDASFDRFLRQVAA